MNKMILINTRASNMAKNEGITEQIKGLHHVCLYNSS